jgi:Tfp pilus assembly protein FimT
MKAGLIVAQTIPGASRPTRTSRYRSFSQLELLIVSSLLAITATATIPFSSKLYHKTCALIALSQVRLALNYARSVAIAEQQTVTMCPSYNRYSCSGSWHQGILVVAPNSKTRFFATFCNSKAILTLTQSGYTNNKVDIQVNGMTYTNGHFSYKSLKPTFIAQFNLYFNRALRSYILGSD